MTENFNEDMNKNIIEALQQSQAEEDIDSEEDVLSEGNFEEADMKDIHELVEDDVMNLNEEAGSLPDDDFSVLDEIEEEPVMSAEQPQEDVLYEEMAYDTPQEEPVYETPVYEEPKYETPHVEEQYYEAPKYEAAEEDTPSYDNDVAPHAVVEKLADEIYQFEIPSNVAVLKKLISQLPSGVTRQTGAQIIKQTMEALGISMRSVLQDAQAVQEKLNSSAKECQATIQEYKRQIATLEEQASSYKKQYNNLNDLVSLFIQH